MSLENTSAVNMQPLFQQESLSNLYGASIDSYNVFEKVRKRAREIITEEKFLSENDVNVMRLRMSFWIFDRLINGPWEFGKAGVKKITNADGLVAQFGSDNAYIFRPLIDLDGKFIDESHIDTWSPIIALYSKAKEVLLINEAYYRAMGTNPREFGILIKEGRMAELFKKKDAEQLKKLTFLLSQGQGYKNEILHPARTDKIIAWNSTGNEGSGSIRIGKDITNGEHSPIPESEHKAFSLGAEKSMDNFEQKIKSVFEKMQPLEIKGTERWLRALSACSSAMDMFWENGPYYMNIWTNGINGNILANKNYADLIGKGSMIIKPQEIYSEDILLAIGNKFLEGYKSGHYEDSFPITTAGVTRNIAWHRYFPKNARGLDSGMTFGVGTPAIIKQTKPFGK